MSADRITRQIQFLLEADKLKGVLRRTPLVDLSRRENSAEHSWHLAVTAIVLRDHAVPTLDIARVLEMLAIHDLVEIDAGDTFAYDRAAHVDKAERERAAAERIFGLLPDDQTAHVRALWNEFEAQETDAAKFANAIDRIQALLQNLGAGGGSWRDHDLVRADVLRRMAPIERAMPALWPKVVEVIDAFCESGVLARAHGGTDGELADDSGRGQ